MPLRIREFSICIKMVPTVSSLIYTDSQFFPTRDNLLKYILLTRLSHIYLLILYPFADTYPCPENRVLKVTISASSIILFPANQRPCLTTTF